MARLRMEEWYGKKKVKLNETDEEVILFRE